VYRAIKIEQARKVLEQLVARRTTPSWLAERAKIILISLQGVSPGRVAKRLGVTRNTVKKWVKRWNQAESKLRELIEQEVTSSQLEAKIRELLCDAPRSGAPRKFTR